MAVKVDLESYTDEELRELASNCLERLPVTDRIQTVITAFTTKAEFEELEIQVEMSKEQAEEQAEEETEEDEDE